jgi:two-component system response regulator DctR
MTSCAHIIDDDEAIRDALEWLLKSRKLPSTTWDSAEAFLAAWSPEWRGCVVLDIRMNGMSGLECFDVLSSRGCTLPVIFITGHGDVPMAVSALKKGAFDFVEKPFDDQDLVAIVTRALELDHERSRSEDVRGDIRRRLALLTAREQEVMQHIVEGKYNKVIADDLSISMRTVEAHRSKIFEKMEVRSAVELVQLLRDAEA